MPGAERGRLMNKVADLIDENAEELAALETLDSGMFETTLQFKS